VTAAPPSADATPPGVPAALVESHFKLIFLVVTGLTVLLLAMELAIAALAGDPSDAMNRVFDTCDNGFKVGIGAIFGLMGGKVLP
jgi:hypothetical protein